MRLLMHAPYFRPHVGGVESFAEELAGALWATGRVHELVIAAADIPGGAPREERDEHGTRIVRYAAADVIPNFPVPRPSALAVLRAAAVPRPDVVVGHTRFFPASALARLHAAGLRRPYVHIEHGSGPVQLDSPLAAGVARAYDATVGVALLRTAAARVAISGASQDFVRRLADRDATVLRRGLPLDRLDGARPHPRADALAGDGPLVAYVGRLIDGKGVRDLLEALAGTAVPCRGVVVGDGPRRADLEAQAGAAGLTGRLTFTGQVPEDEAIAWMRAADVVVNPSYTEGLPTGVLLASACGTPVVATDVGGTGEVVVDGVTGLLVAPRDVRGLRRALETVVRDADLRARLGAAAREHVRSCFSWEHTANGLLDIAAAAVADHAAGRS